MRRGFTLIELLVVVAIIGLLASIISVSVNSARIKSIDARRLVDMRTMATALDLMYSTEGHYPCLNWQYSTQQFFLDYLVRHGYLKSDPRDPKNTWPIGQYTYSSFKASVGGQCGQYYQIDYDVEAVQHTPGTQCGMNGGDGRWITSTHCHYDYPSALLCSDPYFLSDTVPADCALLQDNNIDL